MGIIVPVWLKPKGQAPMTGKTIAGARNPKTLEACWKTSSDSANGIDLEAGATHGRGKFPPKEARAKGRRRLFRLSLTKSTGLWKRSGGTAVPMLPKTTGAGDRIDPSLRTSIDPRDPVDEIRFSSGPMPCRNPSIPLAPSVWSARKASARVPFRSPHEACPAVVASTVEEDAGRVAPCGFDAERDRFGSPSNRTGKGRRVSGGDRRHDRPGSFRKHGTARERP